ncbi:MAG TPA: hypothetical protein DEP72_05495 [Clostridiales bacterium]|nr:MAG: hypothetical protein A2Y18_03080 [Clostridiales bacterium GWD2_32_19]HCC07596.1 hypothetical protein [Clostridiales bacterium]
MSITTGKLAQEVANMSSEFEKNNSELKKQYIIYNIQAFNRIVSTIDTSRGTFGEGYPYYVLDNNLNGDLPIINEQLRYNDQLVTESEKDKAKVWKCGTCLTENYDQMPDLKKICIPCEDVDIALKPRKIINRLPDFDIFVICEDERMNETSIKLEKLMHMFNIYTSDVNPLDAIKNVKEISENLKNGIMPNKFLPIDLHIVEYSVLTELILDIPKTLEDSKQNNQNPYMPMSPLAYRKKWQYDNDPCNFMFDFLFSFTPFGIDAKLREMIDNTRFIISNNYTSEELYGFAYNMSRDDVKRRMQTPYIIEIFKSKIESWRKLPTKEIGTLETTKATTVDEYSTEGLLEHARNIGHEDNMKNMQANDILEKFSGILGACELGNKTRGMDMEV